MSLPDFDPDGPRRCDECEHDYWPGPSAQVTSFGRFCSLECADRFEAAFTEHMKRRGWMEQPDDLAADVPPWE